MKTSKDLFFLFLVALLAACNGRTVETDPPSPVSVFPPTKIEKKDTSEIRTKLCNQFFAVVDAAFDLHINVPKGDSSARTLLKETYQPAVARMAKHYLPDNVPTKKMEELYVSLESEITDCAPYEKAALLFDNDSKPKNDYFAFTLRYALNEFLKNLDPFSRYRLESGVGKNLWGTGILFQRRTDYALGRKPNYLIVEQFLESSLNHSLGEKTRIYEIEQKDESFVKVQDISFDLAVSMLSHAPLDQKEIQVKVARKNRTDDSTYNPISTEILKLGAYQPLFARLEPVGSDAGIMLLRLPEFFSEEVAEHAKDSWMAALQDMLDRDLAPARGLILDLRGNGGGPSSQGNEISKIFLPVRSVYGHFNEVLAPQSPNENSTINGKPALLESRRTLEERPIDVDTIVVLVDRETASATELIVAALRDYERALIVGERTYGKGIGQSSFSLQPPLLGQCYVTNLIVFSPKGLNHQGKGIQPHIEITDPVVALQARKANLPSRMEDLGEVVDTTVIEQARSYVAGTTVDPIASDQRISSQIVAKLQEAKRNMLPPASCNSLPNTSSETFREEDDCLLDWGVLLMQKLLELRDVAAGSV